MDNLKNENKQEMSNMETQETNTSSSYSTEDNNGSKTIVKNSNRIIELLKKNLKKITIIGVFTIIGAVATVYSVLPPKIINSLKNEINQKVTLIEESFHPNEIQIDSFSSPDYQLIKDFQIDALGVVREWKKINTMESIAEYNTVDLQMLLNAILSRLEVINTFDKETTKVQTNVSSIIDYGKKNNIQQYVRGADKLTDLYLKAGKRDEYFSKTKQTLINDFTKLMAESVTDPNSITNEKVVKVIAPLDEIYNNKEVLDYTNTLFSWIIEVNRDYMDYLKYSKSK